MLEIVILILMFSVGLIAYILKERENRELDKIRLHFYEQHGILLQHVKFCYFFGDYQVYLADRFKVVVNEKKNLTDCPLCKKEVKA